jgi:hypothetical protein
MLGTPSEQGERAMEERLLTIVRTCQLQQLNALVSHDPTHLCCKMRTFRARRAA